MDALVCPACEGRDPDCQVCGGRGNGIPQLADANLPDALVLWMGAIQEQINTLKGQAGASPWFLFIGLVLGFLAGHFLS